MNILLIGSGGREHALAYALARSASCSKLYCAPGNAGIARDAECVEIDPANHPKLIEFCRENAVDFVVIGPEQPLVDGLADDLRAEGLKVFGPSKAAAQLEGSKGFMKDFCARHNIPTAAYARFKNADDAKSYVSEHGAPIVIKTDGLAAGKGVVIPQTVEEAHREIDEIMSENRFGRAGAEIVIEDFMEGEELSYFALADGKTYAPLTSAQDHKRAFDGDQGPNTGGMGAYSPAHFMDAALEQRILKDIIEPTVKGMAADGVPFQGILYAGLMITPAGPKLIEYNIRFGDPECQPIMLRFKGDLVKLLLATDDGTLAQIDTPQFKDETALCVVMAANGYPEIYEKGTPITGADDDNLYRADGYLFHAGTMRDHSGQLVNSGGRVLGLTALGANVSTAQDKAYDLLQKIDWPDGFYRTDIGWRAVAREKKDAA